MRIRRYVINLLAALLFVNLTNTLASAATLTYTDGVCEYRVAYDLKKIDGGQLKASLDFLAGTKNAIELPPALTTSEDIATIDIPAYRRRCAASHRLLAQSIFVALDGLDELRRREIEELDAACALSEALLAAAKGDIAPARAYAAACTRYMDLLALPAPRLKSQWNDLVMDLCQALTERNICAGELQRRGEGQGSETRRRLAVLERWRECATKPGNDAADEKQKLLQKLAKRYKAKSISCAR